MQEKYMLVYTGHSHILGKSDSIDELIALFYKGGKGEIPKPIPRQLESLRNLAMNEIPVGSIVIFELRPRNWRELYKVQRREKIGYIVDVSNADFDAIPSQITTGFVIDPSRKVPYEHLRILPDTR